MLLYLQSWVHRAHQVACIYARLRECHASCLFDRQANNFESAAFKRSLQREGMTKSPSTVAQ